MLPERGTGATLGGMQLRSHPRDRRSAQSGAPNDRKWLVLLQLR
jgi:hypothetical protein